MSPRPGKVLLEQACRRRIFAVMERGEQVGVGRGVAGLQGRCPTPAIQRGRKIQPAMVEGCPARPKPPGRRAEVRRRARSSGDRFVQPAHLAECHAKVSVGFEVRGVETHRFTEGGEAAVPLPKVAEDDAEGVVIAGECWHSVNGRPGQLQCSSEPVLPVGHQGEKVQCPRMPWVGPQHFLAQGFGGRSATGLRWCSKACAIVMLEQRSRMTP